MTLRTSSLTPRVGLLGGLFVAVLLVAEERTARADLIAAYLQGHGGVSSVHVDGAVGHRADGAPGLGVQAGFRLLGLEVFGDHTSYGGGAAVQRGIVGLRLGFGHRDTRLELRAGGGVIGEHGGALVGPLAAPSRAGALWRVGANLERRVSPALFFGGGVNYESFILDGSSEAPVGGILARDGWIRGSNIFATLHLKFEVGI